MVVSLFFQVALSCGVVLLYSFVGKVLVSCFGFRRRSKIETECEDGEEEEEKELECEESDSSHDALHLLRLSNAFCPSGTEPSIFGRDLYASRDARSLYSDENERGADAFSDVLEEASFCLRDSFENAHTRRISIKPPASVHKASIAEIETGDHKSTSTGRRSSTTYAPETLHHENEKSNRLFTLISKGTGSYSADENGNRKRFAGFHHNNTCSSEPHGTWSNLSDKRKKLFTVRPSIGALRRLNQTKQSYQAEKAKLSTHANRIDYMNTVRTRFRLISQKKMTFKPLNKMISSSHPDISPSEIDARRMSPVFFTAE